MFSQPTSPAPPNACPPGGPEALAALTVQRLAELDRLRAIGFQQVRRLTALSKLLTPEQEFKSLTGSNGAVVAYDRMARAIRQIMMLEFELRGLFPAPDRDAPRRPKSDRADREPPEFETLFGDLRDFDDLKLRSDYRTGPLADVVAGIRKTLGAEPPPNDPFAPSREPKPAAPANATVPSRPGIAARILPPRRPASANPQSAQAEPARKAATLAIKALGGKGFRAPAKSRNRTNRGPPK